MLAHFMQNLPQDMSLPVNLYHGFVAQVNYVAMHAKLSLPILLAALTVCSDA